MIKLIVLVAQSCPALCGPRDCSPAGSTVHEILQARILEWVAIPFSRGSSQPRVRTWVSHIGRQILYCLSHQGSPPGSSAHGILQARVLEWAAIFSSRGSSSARIKPKSLEAAALQADSLPLSHREAQLGGTQSVFMAWK